MHVGGIWSFFLSFLFFYFSLNKTSFLNQEKSQISHDLKKLEQKKLIVKANGYVRFKEFTITKDGISKAEKLIKKMGRILSGI